MEELIIKNTIQFNASAEKIWNYLTNPDLTKLYMFGCEALSEWKVGSELNWQANYEGNDIVFVKGHIKVIEPYVKLVYTTFDPNSTIEDVPKNYLDVTYLLEEIGDVTILTVTQGDYASVAEGERRYQESYNNGEGWNPILIEIKKLIEN